MKYFSILIFLLFTLQVFSQSGKNNSFHLSADSLEKYTEVYIGANWAYHPGDSLIWADPDYDDSGWEIAPSTLNSFELPDQGFEKRGWFRIKLQVDSSLLHEPLAMDFWLSGACEVYINGEKRFEFGKVINNDYAVNEIPDFPIPVVFDNSTRYVIAVRYFNPSFEEFVDVNYSAGFALSIGFAEESIAERYDYLSENLTYKLLFITIPLSLAILHLFLFLFDNRQKQNLFYVLFLVFFSLFIYVNFTSTFTSSAVTRLVLFRMTIGALSFTLLFGATTIYSIYKPLPSYYKYVLLFAVILSIAGYFKPGQTAWYITYIFITIVSIGGSQVLYNPARKKPTGSDGILQTGFAVMAVAGIYQMLISIGVLESFEDFGMPYIYGVLFFIFTMSISLARDFAVTRKVLEKKLVEVKELSDKTLRQELAAKDLETQRKILESDNKRKTDELEAARSVQFSMLPACERNMLGFDACFEMHPATEVGGDYYDYIITEDETLNIAVGDATGHGMKAGIMVATVKALFSALGTKMMIPDFFEKSTSIIKNMTLGNLFMSLTIVRIKNKHIHGSAAGMPPLLVYRKETNSVEEILIKSMPLGAHKNFPYNTFDFDIMPGDVLLFMSDGFTEMFNDDKEMLGVERTKEFLIEANGKNANDIVQFLLGKGKEWRNGKPQKDDVTFVVLKAK